MSSESEEEAEFDGHEDEYEDEEDESAASNNQSSAEEEDDDDDDDDDDVPLSALKQPNKKSSSSGPSRTAASSNKKRVSYKEASTDEEEDVSSDDDIPLSALATSTTPSPKKKQNGNKKTTKKKTTSESPAKKKSKTTTTTNNNYQTTTTTSSSSSNKNYEWASAALYGTESIKGLLIQRLLCRWWYAYTWPDPSTLPKRPPPHYDSLDGFPGVYVCTEGPDVVGKIRDVRDASQTPSFANFYKKSSQELQQMLLSALENQKKQLIQSEGTGTATEKEIDTLYKWTQKVDPTKADKEAVKILKAQGLSVQ